MYLISLIYLITGNFKSYFYKKKKINIKLLKLVFVIETTCIQLQNVYNKYILILDLIPQMEYLKYYIWK